MIQDSDITVEQRQAINAVGEWYKRKPRNAAEKIFRLYGPAGTGKTSLADFIAKSLNCSYCYVTFTGKAALVLASKGCQPVSTIHRAIYKPQQDETTGKWTFHLDMDCDLRSYDLVIVDEAPMVGNELGSDLALCAKRILALGDQWQLPPVQDEPFFSSDNPDFLLTEIHRQAADNPIIQLSMLVRSGGVLTAGTYGTTKVMKHRRGYSAELLTTHDQVLTGKNDTRTFVNQEYRKFKGLYDKNGLVPLPDEKLICLRNNNERGFLNGQLYRVLSAEMFDTQDVAITVRAEDSGEEAAQTILTRIEYFEGLERTLDWRQRKSTDEFCYAYGMTCHKAQGSQWDSVLVFDESKTFKEDAHRWLYTAITRAADRLTVLI